jgi:hypothetical protein
MSEVIFSEIIHREIVESLIPNKDAYVNHALSLKDSIKLETDWHCNTYNTIATADLKNDPLFFDIIQQTGRRVIDFANEYSVNAVSITHSTSRFINTCKKNFLCRA